MYALNFLVTLGHFFKNHLRFQNSNDREEPIRTNTAVKRYTHGLKKNFNSNDNSHMRKRLTAVLSAPPEFFLSYHFTTVGEAPKLANLYGRITILQ